MLEESKRSAEQALVIRQFVPALGTTGVVHDESAVSLGEQLFKVETQYARMARSFFMKRQSSRRLIRQALPL